MAEITVIKSGPKKEVITRTKTTCECGARFFEIETIDQYPELQVMVCMHCSTEYLISLQDVDAPIPT